MINNIRQAIRTTASHWAEDQNSKSGVKSENVKKSAMFPIV